MTAAWSIESIVSCRSWGTAGSAVRASWAAAAETARAAATCASENPWSFGPSGSRTWTPCDRTLTSTASPPATSATRAASAAPAECEVASNRATAPAPSTLQSAAPRESWNPLGVRVCGRVSSWFSPMGKHRSTHCGRFTSSRATDPRVVVRVYAVRVALPDPGVDLVERRQLVAVRERDVGHQAAEHPRDGRPVSRLPRVLEHDILQRDEPQGAVGLGLIDQRLGQRRVEHGVADGGAVDEVVSHRARHHRVERGDALVQRTARWQAVAVRLRDRHPVQSTSEEAQEVAG